MPSFFRRNPDLERELTGEPEFSNGLAEAAKPAAEAAKQLAPFDEGDYHDGIKVTVDGKEVRIDATDFKSHWIEWGTVNQSPQAPLRRGVKAAGLRFKEETK